MPKNTFQSSIAPRKMGRASPFSLFFKEKASSTDRHMWVHVKAAATKMLIFYWFYSYFLPASFEARRDILPKSRKSSKYSSSHLRFLQHL
jgi:hypothetical protein